MKFRIKMVSSERGWGQEYWTEDYDTYEQAKQRIEEVNAKCTAIDVPDYYEKAFPDILVVD